MLVVALWAVLFGSVVTAQNCTTCPDGLNCCGGDICCPYSAKEYMCCMLEPIESCCIGECCLQQTTYCCHKTNTAPDRCCPRWTVCCQSGVEDDCCTPETGEGWKAWMGLEQRSLLYMDYLSTRNTAAADANLDDDVLTRYAKRGASVGETRTTNGVIVYALFMEVQYVKALTINGSSGQIIASYPVNFDNFGEMTRVFMFDEVRELFYYVEANFTSPPPAGGRVVTLYTVDPTNGNVESAVVKGAINFPVGYQYMCAQDAIYMATQAMSVDGNTTGPYTFYAVNPQTAQATLLGTAQASGAGSYAGWFHAISYDGTLAYRLGYENVKYGSNPGLGVTTIKSGSTSWNTNVPVPANHAFYESCNVAIKASNTDPNFFSLAQRTGLSGGFDLVGWQMGGTATVLASLGTDGDPRYFGVDAETLSCDQSVYAGALYHEGALPIEDKWSIAFVDLTTPNATVTQVDVVGLIGEEVSITGIGLPLASVRYLRQHHTPAAAPYSDPIPVATS